MQKLKISSSNVLQLFQLCKFVDSILVWVWWPPNRQINEWHNYKIVKVEFNDSELSVRWLNTKGIIEQWQLEVYIYYGERNGALKEMKVCSNGKRWRCALMAGRKSSLWMRKEKVCPTSKKGPDAGVHYKGEDKWGLGKCLSLQRVANRNGAEGRGYITKCKCVSYIPVIFILILFYCINIVN